MSIKRIALAALFAIAFGSSALAQGCGPSNPSCVVPNRPVGDNAGFAANTRFVTQAVAAGGGGVTSFNGRVGAVTPAANDYSFSQLSGIPTTIAGYGITNARTQLLGSRSYYVNGSAGATATCGPAGVSTCSIGNDSNDCLTPGTACLTLQHALNIVTSKIDLNGFGLIIYLAHNVGTTNYASVCAFGPFLGSSVIVVRGDSAAPTATVIQDPAGDVGLAVKDLCTIEFDYVRFIDAATNNAAGHISVGGTGNAGHVDLGTIDLGPMTIGAQLTVGSLGSIALVGPISFSGSSAIGIVSRDGGLLDFGTQTATMSGAPNYTTSFAYMPNGGVVLANTTTFSGAATGLRCLMPNSPILMSGFNPNAVFPGNVDCLDSNLMGSIQFQNGTGGTAAFSLAWTATPPTISAGFCATSPSISAANGIVAFDINVGTACAGSVGTLAMPAAKTGWVCGFHNVTNPATNIVEQTGGATNTVTLTNYVRTTGVAGNFTASDHIRGSCSGY